MHGGDATTKPQMKRGMWLACYVVKLEREFASCPLLHKVSWRWERSIRNVIDLAKNSLCKSDAMSKCGISLFFLKTWSGLKLVTREIGCCCCVVNVIGVIRSYFDVLGKLHYLQHYRKLLDLYKCHLLFLV